MDSFRRKHTLTFLCTKLTCSVKVGEGQKEICSSVKWFCIFLTEKAFSLIKLAPNRSKGSDATYQLPNWKHLQTRGCEKRKLVLLKNENQYMKVGMSCLWGTKALFRAQTPSPSHLVQQQQQLKSGKSSLLLHSPILLGMSHPQCIMKRNNL